MPILPYAAAISISGGRFEYLCLNSQVAILSIPECFVAFNEYELAISLSEAL